MAKFQLTNAAIKHLSKHGHSEIAVKQTLDHGTQTDTQEPDKKIFTLRYREEKYVVGAIWKVESGSGYWLITFFDKRPNPETIFTKTFRKHQGQATDEFVYYVLNHGERRTLDNKSFRFVLTTRGIEYTVVATFDEDWILQAWWVNDTPGFGWTDHVKERMASRGINRETVVFIYKNGSGN